MDRVLPRLRWRALVCIYFVLVTLTACSGSTEGDNREIITYENLLIRCLNECSDVIAKINNAGGNVYKNYKNVTAIAATVPSNILAALEKSGEIKSASKDLLVVKPVPKQNFSINDITGSINARTLKLDNDYLQATFPTLPKNYSFNNNLTGAADLHAQDITGSGVIVAVIDTGTANNAEIVPALEGNVIGGESFIDFPDEPSATSTMNDDHGTMVGTMIAGHLGIVIPTAAPLVQSLLSHTPESVIELNDTDSLIPMMGSAPDAQIYALKVFAAEGEGTPSSVIIEAMDRALTLKRNYNDGIPSEPTSGDGSEDNPYVYDSLNIEVVNMSLGGLSMFPGFEIEDLLALEMLEEGITVVTAAGNEGFGAITGGSPGTSVASLNVGAANTPQHERILRDMQGELGDGILFRPTDHVQIAPFSSRGPTADGREGISVVANGLASFVQGAGGGISLISGTSFSSPTTAGGAALLHQAAPDATANMIKMAIIDSADTDIFGDFNVTAIDRGAGFINLTGALEILDQSGVNDDIPMLPDVGDQPTRVENNIAGLGIYVMDTDDNNVYTRTINLRPGEVEQIFMETEAETGSITIEISDYQASVPEEEQNAFFGDAFLLTLLDAPTSANVALLDERIQEDATYTIDKPQSGILRLALMGDWTNVGDVTASVRITATESELDNQFATGRLTDEELDIYEFNVSNSVSELNFELIWRADWGRYPPHDIDLILVDPDGEMHFDGATLDIPERVSIPDPITGKWTVLVDGYMLHGFEDRYELFITDQNNRRLRRSRR